MASGEASRDPSSTRAPRGSYTRGRAVRAHIPRGRAVRACVDTRSVGFGSLSTLGGGGCRVRPCGRRCRDRPAISHLWRVALRCPSALLPTIRALSGCAVLCLSLILRSADVCVCVCVVLCCERERCLVRDSCFRIYFAVEFFFIRIYHCTRALFYCCAPRWKLWVAAGALSRTSWGR